MDTVEIGGRQVRLTSLGSRWLGQFLDGIIYAVIFFMPVLVLGLAGVQSESLVLVGVLPALLYLFFQDGLEGGQSLGKRVMGSRVVDGRTGRPCSFGQSFVRNFSLVLLSFFDWVFIFGDHRQRLGDKLAGTYVVDGP